MVRGVRGGASGLRQHRRTLLHPFTVREKEFRSRDDLQPWETEEFHSLHRLFTQASELGPQLWDYKTSRELAEHFQISAYIIESVCWPSAPRSRSRSPRPSSTGAAASSSAVQTPVPSSVRPRLVGVEVINEHRVEDAASRLVDILNIGQGRAQDSVCLLDFNGVINDSWSDSVRVLQDLRHHGIKVGVLSYCRSPGTIRSTREYLQALGQEVCLYLPAVIAPRPVARDCRRAGDWCKAGLLRELPPCKLRFIDDRADIVADCSRLVESQSFRAILCHKGLVQGIVEWTVPKRGSHYLDLADTRVVRLQD